MEISVAVFFPKKKEEKYWSGRACPLHLVRFLCRQSKSRGGQLGPHFSRTEKAKQQPTS